jgi:hypothetical protein
MSEEEWKEIIYYKNYEISNFGKVRNKTTKQVLKVHIVKGYQTITLRYKKEYQKFSIHRLVAIHFIPNPENKPTVNHIDKCRTNNHVDNLEWNTVSEQEQHKNKTKKEAIEFGHGHSRKIIYRINKDSDEILEEYPSMTLAIKWLYDSNICQFKEFNGNTMASIRSRILLQIKGKRKTVYGYKWKFKVDTIEDEIWKDIDPQYIRGVKGYQASNLGRVKSPKGKINIQYNEYEGYKTVAIKYHTQYVHRLIAFAFIPNLENKPIVNHKDGNKHNNHVDNLEWMTASENTQHYIQYLRNK